MPIYDRNGKPLVNRASVTSLAVTPTPEGMEALRESGGLEISDGKEGRISGITPAKILRFSPKGC